MGINLTWRGSAAAVTTTDRVCYYGVLIGYSDYGHEEYVPGEVVLLL